MWSLILVGFVLLMMMCGALIGLFCILIASSSPITKSTAFTWGVVFGPFGIVAMLLKATTRQTLSNPTTDDGGSQIGRHVGLAGAALIIASLALPWFRVTGLDRQLLLVPLTTSILRGPAIVLLLFTLAGVLTVAIRRSVTLLGWASALMFSVSIIIWFMGSRLIAFLPIDIVPSDTAITLGRGSSLGLFGAILVLVSSLSKLLEETWPGKVSFPSTRTLLVGLGVTGLVVFVRDITWVRFDTANLSWGLPADGIPVIGDVLVLILIAGALSAGISIFYASTWLRVICASCGVFIVIGSLLSVFFAGVINRSLDWLRGQSPSLLGEAVDTSTTRGPYLTAIVGLVLLIFGLVSRSGTTHLDSSSRFDGHLSTVPLAPPDPF